MPSLLSPEPRHIATFAVLTALGLVGNMLHVSLFFGVDLVFGSIFVLTVAWLYGPWAGLLSGLLAHAYTMEIWGHPYAFLGFSLEAFVVGWLVQRYKRNVLVADLVYWALLGMPLAWVFYSELLGFGTTQAGFIVLKQPANGLLNALLTTLLAYALPLRRWAATADADSAITLRSLLLTMIMTFVCFASFAAAMSNASKVYSDVVQTAGMDLNVAAGHLRSEFRTYVERHREWLRQFNTGDASLRREVAGRFLAVVRVDELGTLTVQANPAGVDAAVLQRAGSLGCGRGVGRWPWARGLYYHSLNTTDGCLYGVAATERLRQLLLEQRFRANHVVTLIDADAEVVAGTDPAMRPGEIYSVVLQGGHTDDVFHHLGGTEATPTMARWMRSFYIKETAADEFGTWRLVVALPFGPYVDQLQSYYIRIFAVMLAVIVVALLVSLYVRAFLMRSLNELVDLTASLPERIGAGAPIAWPRSPLFEVDAAVRNVQRMSDLLSNIFAESEQRYQALFDSTNDAVLVLEPVSGVVMDINAQALELTGRGRDELVNEPVYALLPEEERSRLRRTFLDTRLGRNYGGVPLTLLHRDGRGVPVEATPLTMRLKGRDVILVVFRDETDRQRAREQLQLVANVFENTTEGIMITDRKARLLKVNKAFTDITGFGADEVVGQTPRILHSNWQDEAFYRDMWQAINDHGEWQGELWNRRKDGTLFAEWLSISAVKEPDGRVNNYIGIFIDITEQKRVQERIHTLAFYDPLTKLPNRMLFKDRLRHAMDASKREQRRLALLFMDLDNFKAVNDSIGHHAGDLLLQQVAHRVTGVIRESDTFARLGGDEFTLVLEDVDGAGDVSSLAKKILREVARPMQIEGREIVTTASIGACFYPDDGDTLRDLMKHADTAMYRAKAVGRNGYAFFTPEMNRAASERLELESGLRNAMARGELQVYFQPQVATASDSIAGAEALLRWTHPQRGPVSPVEFIPIAEESGLIEGIGDWVLEYSCTRTVEWLRRGHRVRVAVNVADYQFRQADYPQRVRRILDKTGVPPELVELELTERVIMDVAESRDRLEALKALGVSLSIDDFGTGHSSLGYLKRFRIDRLKIDRSFIEDLPDDEQDRQITEAIIRMAHALGMQVTAEGIETPAQLAFVRERGCEEYQGFLFGKPMPEKAFRRLLEERTGVAHGA